MALVVKNLPANAEEETSVLCLGQEKSPGGGRGNPIQYSCQKIHEQRSLAGDSPRVTKSWTRLKQLSKNVHKRGFCEAKRTLFYH